MAYLQGDAIAGCPGRLGRFRGGNRAMTAAEMASLYTAGVAEADRGASVADIAGNIANIGSGIVGSGRQATYTASPNDASCTTGGNILVPVRGKRIRVSVTISGYTAGRIKVSAGQAGSLVTLNTNGTFIFEMNNLTTSNGFLYFFSGGVTTLVLTVNFVVVVGQTIDLQPSAIQLVPGQWLEAANSQHLILPDNTRQKQFKTVGQVRGVNTWAASPALQYIGANANILPANAVLTLYARATVSTTFNIGDQTDVDRYGAAVTIGTEFAPVAVLKHGSDGTNRRLTITPTASYTGTVTTMWRVEMVG